jgi:hypothetical protein
MVSGDMFMVPIGLDDEGGEVFQRFPAATESS